MDGSHVNESPILVTGADRSGTTLLYALLASHPEMMMVRRTNVWRWFDRKYGDLRQRENLDRCLDAMTRYPRMDVLDIRRDAVLAELDLGDVGYGDLFATVFRQAAERAGAQRWGDKSLHTELFADRVFEEWPNAKMIHVVRDPRDRHASVIGRRGTDRNSIGSIMGRWIKSVRAGERHQPRHPTGFMTLRFEDLVTDTDETLRAVCSFAGLEYDSQMLDMSGGDEDAKTGGNSSFDAIPSGQISRKPIGRYRTHLEPELIALIQRISGRRMRRLGYELDGVDLSPRQQMAVTGRQIVAHVRIAAWEAAEYVGEARGRGVPERRLRKQD